MKSAPATGTHVETNVAVTTLSPVNVMVMGNHGVLILGRTVAETWNRLYYFERAAETYIRALQTGRPLRYLSAEVAEQVAVETETYPGQAERHMADMLEILDREGSDFRG